MAIFQKTIEGLTNDETYYTKVFTVNHKERVNNRIDLPVISAIPCAFPAEPTSYNLIDTYTASQTFTAPEDGWYQIELFGASHRGGVTPARGYDGKGYYVSAGAGGGGGGAYVCSRVKMNQGDTISIASLGIGSTATVTINSSLQTYNIMKATSATAGSNGSADASSRTATGGAGGAGGVATGGNVSNNNGSNGATGRTNKGSSNTIAVSVARGGASGYTGGNSGGNGAYYSVYNTSAVQHTNGKAGFCKIYRGDTNIVA